MENGRAFKALVVSLALALIIISSESVAAMVVTTGPEELIIDNSVIDSFAHIDTSYFSVENNGTERSARWDFQTAPTNRTPTKFKAWANLTDLTGTGSAIDMLTISVNGVNTTLWPKKGSLSLNKNFDGTAGLYLDNRSNVTITFNYSVGWESFIKLRAKVGNGSSISTVTSASLINISNGLYTASFLRSTDCTNFALKNLKNSTGFNIYLENTAVAGYNGGPDWRGAGGAHAEGTYGGGCVGLGTHTMTYPVNSSLLFVSASAGGTPAQGQINTTFTSSYPFWLSDFAGDGTWTNAQLIHYQDGARVDAQTYGVGWPGTMVATNFGALQAATPYTTTAMPICFYKFGHNSTPNQQILISNNGTPSSCSWTAQQGTNTSGTFSMNQGSWDVKDVSAGVANWTWGLCDGGTGWGTCMAIHNLTRTNVLTFSADIGTAKKMNNIYQYNVPNSSNWAAGWANDSISAAEGYLRADYIVMDNSTTFPTTNFYASNGSATVADAEWCAYFYGNKTSTNSSRCDIDFRGRPVVMFEKTNTQNMHYRITGQQPSGAAAPDNSPQINVTTFTLADVLVAGNVNFTYKPWTNTTLNKCTLFTNETGTWQSRATNASLQTNNTLTGISYTPTKDAIISWNVVCNDTVGFQNQSIVNQTFDYDPVGPNVTLWSPNQNNTIRSNGTIALNASCFADFLPTCAMTAMRNGTGMASSGFVNDNATTNMTFQLLEGANAIWVNGSDALGKAGSNSSTIFVTYDMAPNVTWNAPLPNLTNYSNTFPQIKFTAKDNISTVLTAWLFVNGTVYASNTSVLNGTATNLSASGIGAGVWYSSVTVSDGVNNASTPVFWINLSIIAPTITIFSPSSGANTSSDVVLNFSFTNISAAVCTYYLRSENVVKASNVTITNCQNGTTITLNTTWQQNISVFVASNQGVGVTSVFFNYNPNPPIVNYTSTTATYSSGQNRWYNNASNFTNANMNFNFSTNINVTVIDARVTAQMASGSGLADNYTSTGSDNSTLFYRNGAGAYDGNNSYWGLAADTSYGQNWGISTNRWYWKDANPPVTNIASPSTGFVTNDTSITIAYTAIDVAPTPSNISECWYEIDNGANTSIGSCANGSITGSLVSGNHTIYLFANDRSGNVGGTRIFYTYQPNISISFISPSDSNKTISATRNFTVINISSNVNLTNASVEFNGTNYTMNTSNATIWTYNKTGLQQGYYLYRVWSIDVFGRVSVSESRSYTYSAFPLSSTTSPTNGSKSSNPVAFIFLVSPYIYSTVDISYTVDGGSLNSICTSCSSTTSSISITPYGYHQVVVSSYSAFYDAWDNESINFTNYFAIYNFTFYDEMTGLPWNVSLSNLTVNVYCGNQTTVIDVTSYVSLNNAFTCSFTEIRALLDFGGGNIYYRTLVPNTTSGNVTFYLLNVYTTTTVVKKVTVPDITGFYVAGSRLSVVKIILTNGTFDIIEQLVDAERKVILALAVNEKYHLYISRDGTSTDLGEFITTAETTATIDVSGIAISPTIQTVSTNISYNVSFYNTTSSVGFSYNDTTNQTTYLFATLYNQSNLSQVFANQTCSSPNCALTFSVAGHPNTTTYILRFWARNTDFGTIFGSAIVSWLGAGGRAFPFPLVPEILFIPLSVMLLFCVAFLFSENHAGAGTIVLAMFGGFLIFIGWLPQSWTVAIGLVLAVGVIGLFLGGDSGT